MTACSQKVTLWLRQVPLLRPMTWVDAPQDLRVAKTPIIYWLSKGHSPPPKIFPWAGREGMSSWESQTNRDYYHGWGWEPLWKPGLWQETKGAAGQRDPAKEKTWAELAPEGKAFWGPGIPHFLLKHEFRKGGSLPYRMGFERLSLPAFVDDISHHRMVFILLPLAYQSIKKHRCFHLPGKVSSGNSWWSWRFSILWG